MCKELPVIPVNKVVGPKRIIGQKWRAKEDERHKGSLTHKKIFLVFSLARAPRGRHCDDVDDIPTMTSSGSPSTKQDGKDEIGSNKIHKVKISRVRIKKTCKIYNATNSLAHF
jgi:hypothetical protein